MKKNSLAKRNENVSSKNVPKRQVTFTDYEDGRKTAFGYSDEGNKRTVIKTEQDGNYYSKREINFDIPNDKKSAQDISKKLRTKENFSPEEIAVCTNKKKSTVYGYLR